MKNLFPAAFVVTLPLLFSSLAQAAVVYSVNSFTNSLGGGVASAHLISNANWTAEYGTAASITGANPNDAPIKGGLYDGASSAAPFALTDYIYIQKAGIDNQATLSQDAMLRTTTLPLGAFAPSSYSMLTATWHRNGQSAASIRFMVQTGGSWYISDTNINGTGNGTVTYPALSLDLLASTWTNLGANVSFGGTTGITYATLFGGGQTITGIGFYIDDLVVETGTNASTARFDNLAIDGTLIPEPSTSLLGVFGFSLIVFRRKK